MIINTLEQKVRYESNISEILLEQSASTNSRLRTAEDFGFKGDNYYTAEQKRLIRNRKGNPTAGSLTTKIM